MKHKLFIEIFEEKKTYTYLDSCDGCIRVNSVGSINFEIFRDPVKKVYFKMRVYNNFMSTLVPEFSETFTSLDYNNRKMIKWIGQHANELVKFQCVLS